MSWEEENKRFLIAAIERIAKLLDNAQEGLTHATDSQLPAWPQWHGSVARAPAIEQLTQRFELTPFERDVVLMAAGVEIDRRIAELCAVVGGDGHGWPCFRLALSTLPDASWDALLPAAPLRRWKLVRLESCEDLNTSRLRLDERIWHFLLGLSGCDATVLQYARPVTIAPGLVGSHQRVAQALANLWARCRDSGAFPTVRLEGRSTEVQAGIVQRAAEERGWDLLRLPLEELPTDSQVRRDFATAWQRETRLCPRVLLLDAQRLDTTEGSDVQPALSRLLDELSGPLVTVGWERGTTGEKQQVPLEVAPALAEEQHEAWQQALQVLSEMQTQSDEQKLQEELPTSPTPCNESSAPQRRGPPESSPTASQFVARFDLDLPAVRGALQLAEVKLAASPGAPVAQALWTAAREHTRQHLGLLAQRIEAKADWGDLSLPDAQIAQLRQLERCVRHQYQVHCEWDFGRGSDRGRGIVALFAGPSGTGKTLAAEVIANALQLDLYRVDLSAISSKWVGETEKNLRRVFDGAEAGGALLLFDEAEALFGQRGAVQEARDRQANMQVNYLLQRIETFRGLAILTTNLKENLDAAMHRRLRFVVDFSFPNEQQRENIWRRVFPPATPTQGLDPARLARLSVSGATIHSIAWMAACLAADDQQAVSMPHVLQAARWEYQKSQKVLVSAEVSGWDDSA